MAEGINQPQQPPRYVAGTAVLRESSIWLGEAMLLAYRLGHSVLCWLNGVQRWLPGRRAFAAVLVLAGGWLII